MAKEVDLSYIILYKTEVLGKIKEGKKVEFDLIRDVRFQDSTAKDPFSLRKTRVASFYFRFM